MFHGTLSLDIANGIKALRERNEAARIPSSMLDETLSIATWNIREFGKARRSEAAIHHIAEIIDSEPLFPGLGKDKFTFQMSDHLPLWMQMNTDIDGQELDQIIRARSLRRPR